MDLVLLHLEFLLAIAVTAHMESLEIKIFSWLNVNENDTFTQMLNVSAANLLKEGINL